MQNKIEQEQGNDECQAYGWCNAIYPTDEMRKEVKLGYICSSCQRAIKSRGETLTFEE